jgi:mRNA (guanine-N7-)-methyltransferase
MPAFDPVRDAVLNSPVDAPSRSPSFARRATDLSVLLNDGSDVYHPLPFHRPTPSIHALLAPDDALAAAEPIRRTSASTTAPPITHIVSKPLPLPYKPTKRRTAPDTVLVPLSSEEIQIYRNYRGQGVQRLSAKRKRPREDEPDPADARPSKRHTGDVGVVVQHC